MNSFMMKQVEHFDNLQPFSHTVYGCRIYSIAEAYGLDEPFAQFWCQDDRAAVAKIDSVLVLDLYDGADLEEVASFCRMVGAEKVLCDANAAKKLGFSAAMSGPLMMAQNEEKPLIIPEHEFNPSIRELYNLLQDSETETFRAPEFESFYMDLSHRIRHGTAAAAGIRKNGCLEAVAVCTAQACGKAVISSVAVRPGARRNGLGSGIVRALASHLPQRELYVFRAERENEHFYQNLGFQDCGKWAECGLS